MNNRREARFLFEISRAEWSAEVRDAQRHENSRLAEGVERWRGPLIARGELYAMSATLFLKHDPEKCEAVFRKDHAQTKS